MATSAPAAVTWYLVFIVVYLVALFAFAATVFAVLADDLFLAARELSDEALATSLFGSPLWLYDGRAKFVDAASADGRTFEAAMSSYRSRTWPSQYGVSRTARRRTDERGFSRTLLDYRRTSVVYVPDESEDTVSCDAWVNHGANLAASTPTLFTRANGLVECRLSEGSDACFKCREARKYKRVCVHFPVDQTVVNAVGTEHVISANANAEVGWCLPAAFKDIQFDPESGHQGGGRPPPELLRNCNPNTGDWLLASLAASGTSEIDSSYNWVCRCRYPNLMTNLDDPTSDCLKPVGCRPNGRLDDLSASGKVDPYREGKCVCRSDYEPSFAADVGPVCVNANVVNYGFNRALDDIFGRDRGSILDLADVSPQFLSLFPATDRPSLRLANPCHVDVLDGSALPVGASCDIRREQINRVTVVFCVSVHVDYVAVRTDTDYLLNNHGRYANACLYTGQTNDRAKLDVVRQEIPGPAFHLSYYNLKRFPDVGHIVNPELYREGSRNRRRADQIARFIINDRVLLDWWVRYVEPYRHYNAEPKYRLRFNASSIYDGRYTFVVFNDYPQIDRNMSFAESLSAVPFQRQLFDILNRQSSVKCSPLGMMTLIDRRIMHPKRFTYYKDAYDVYRYMDEDEYNSFLVPPIQEVNCLGRGRILPGQPIDAEYRDVPNQPSEMRAGVQQYFIKGDQTEYPTRYSFDNCTDCPDADGQISDQISRDVPKMWPVVIHGNRRLCPNKFHRTFDATVQVFITSNFANISTTGLCANYLDYRSPKNISRYEFRPDGLTNYA